MLFTFYFDFHFILCTLYLFDFILLHSLYIISLFYLYLILFRFLYFDSETYIF